MRNHPTVRGIDQDRTEELTGRSARAFYHA